MRKMILSLALTALMTASVQATPSLGFWSEGYSGSTHQTWEFTDVVGSRAYPEDQVNPNPGPNWINVIGGTIIEGQVVGSPDITFDVLLPNYTTQNPTKEIWVDLGLQSGTIGEGVDAPSVGVGPGYSWISLQGSSPTGQGTSFGFRIFPNPDFEDILITIKGGAVAPAMLGWVHVDTICVPAPGAVLLGSLGVGLIGWLRRRRTL